MLPKITWEFNNKETNLHEINYNIVAGKHRHRKKSQQTQHLQLESLIRG